MAMSVTNGLLWIRTMTGLTDTTLPGPSDAEITRFINGRYLTIWKTEKRAVETALVSFAVNDHVKTSSISTAAEILGVTRDVSGSRKAGMERMEWNELRNLQDFDSTTGTPIRYAAHKSTADETWQIAVHPVPDGTYAFNAIHTAYPTELTTTSTPVLGDAEAYWLYRLAAADVALVVGRPDLIDEILKPIPEAFMAKFGMEQKRQDPKRRDETAVV